MALVTRRFFELDLDILILHRLAVLSFSKDRALSCQRQERGLLQDINIFLHAAESHKIGVSSVMELLLFTKLHGAGLASGSLTLANKDLLSLL